MSLSSWFKKLLGDAPEFRPRPPDWRKTLADLDAEQRSLSGEEIEWAREYEREQLRSWARFPRDGDRYEVLRETEVTYLIDSRGPSSRGGKGNLPAGAAVRALVLAGDAEPIGVYAAAIDEKRIERLLIPEDDRNSISYGGYSLFVSTAQLNRDFRLLEAAGDPAAG